MKKTTVLEDKLFKMLTQNLANRWKDDLISEAGKSLRKNNPCWKGYHPVGTKKKGGRTVPNCVPNEGVAEGEWSNVIHTTDRSAEKAQREQEHKKQAGLAAKVLKNHSQALDPKEIDLLTRYNLHHRGKPGVRLDNYDVKQAQQLIQNVLRFNEQGVAEDWNKVNHHDHTDGLSQKAVNAYRHEHPGSKLQTAVTTKPSKLKSGSKDAKRRKSFCARMSGNKGPMKDEKGRPTPKAKALHRWNCE